MNKPVPWCSFTKASITGAAAVALWLSGTRIVEAQEFTLFTCRDVTTNVQDFAQPYTVPAGITRLAVTLAGASGKGDDLRTSTGGKGAVVSGVLRVTPGDQLSAVAGCRPGGKNGGTGYGVGGNGGNQRTYGNGGGGGGGSAVLRGQPLSEIDLPRLVPLAVAGGGGGGGGVSGLNAGKDGGDAGLNSGTRNTTKGGNGGTNGIGGGAGGGGGGGYRGGTGGNAGSEFGNDGEGGNGGAALIAELDTPMLERGGSPRGNGFVIISPLQEGQPTPTVRIFGARDCAAGGVFDSFIPAAGVMTVGALVVGGSGADTHPTDVTNPEPKRDGGFGARIDAVLDVTPGRQYFVRVGCEGGNEVGGAGLGSGGDPGQHGGAGGGGGASAIFNFDSSPTPSIELLVIAGGGGGVGAYGSNPSFTDRAGHGGDASELGEQGQNGSGGAGGAGGSLPGPDGQKGEDGCSRRGGAGGGGGGGRHGGGRGTSGCFDGGGGGGGGASLLPPGATLISGAAVRRRGNGIVIVHMAPPFNPPGPPNNDFDNAQAITGAGGMVMGTNVNADKEVGEPDHLDIQIVGGEPLGEPNLGGASIWYAWTSSGGEVQFDTCGTTFAPLIAAYTGSVVGALTPVSVTTGRVMCADGTTAPAISFGTSGSGTFYIAIDGKNPGSGPATGTTKLNWGDGG